MKKLFIEVGRCASAMLRQHRATAVALSVLVFAVGFMAGAARAQGADVSKPSFGSWGCDRNAACMAADTQYRQQVIAQNTQVAMQQTAAQSQVNSAEQCIRSGGRIVQTSVNSYTCQNSSQVTSGQVGLTQPGVMQSPQAQQCVAQGGRVVQTGPTSYTCDLGGQSMTPGYVQNSPQVPVCQIAQNGQVMSGGACADPQTGKVFGPCTQGGTWVRVGVNNFQCVMQQATGYQQMHGYQPTQQPMYLQQQRQPQNILGGALDGAMIGYAAQGNRDGLRDGAVAGASRAVIRNVLGF